MMKISDREVYDWLLVSCRYAKSRNNHLEPAYTFKQTIDVLNRWENKEYKVQTAEQILSELSFDTYFINDAINNSPQAKGIESGLRKTYITFATELTKIIDPKKQDKQVQKDFNKIITELDQSIKTK